MSLLIKDSGRLGTPPYKSLDPFLFCVYHKDDFPPGDENMRAPNGMRGNGGDFDHSKPWRFYHGDDVPGFPQHPHRGMQTITATMEGLIDHTDSLGNGGRYGDGDLQWMTAGRGIIHGENFPLLHPDKKNPTRFFQIWLNLAAANKMVPPSQKMDWAENNQETVKTGENGGKARVMVGKLYDASSPEPPKESWANDLANEVGIFLVTLPKGGGQFTLPAAAAGSAINRRIYMHEGAALNVGGTDFKGNFYATLDAGADCVLRNEHPTEDAEVLVMQGRPIGEPVVQRGPFVMNTQQEIVNAFTDYQMGKFGSWPWDEAAVIFPRDKGRFMLEKGVEQRPPGAKK